MDSGLLEGLANSLLSPENLLFVLIGCMLGTIVGVLPGLGPASTLAILLPITLYLPPTGSLIMLSGIYYGAMYGGSTTSILLSVPGEIASAVTTIDGYQMTKQGRAGAALAIAAIGSFIAGLFGAVVISFLGPTLATFGLNFGPPEYCALIIFSLTALVSFSFASIGKGLLAGLAGLVLATVGIDPLSGTPRLDYGTVDLLQGFNLVAVLVGLFGVSEVLDSVSTRTQKVYTGSLGSWWSMIPRGGELSKGLKSSARGTILGYILGLIPGMTSGLTSYLAYDFEKRVSKRPEQLGRGAIEGVAGPEAANNATTMAGFVPLLALGIPTGPSLAIMLAALLMFGLNPGPALFETNGLFVWTIIASMFIANIALLVLNLPLLKVWASISQIPYKLLGPLILVVSLVGAFAPRNSMFDVWTAVAFGFVGLAMKRRAIPSSPLILGFLLGPMLEQSLRQTLALSHGSPTIFLTRPIALVFILLATASLSVMIVLQLRTRRSRKLEEIAAAEGWD